MSPRFGSMPGIDRQATILNVNKEKGKILLSLDEAGIAQNKVQIEVPFPATIYSSGGAFFGYDLKVGTSVLTRQIHGGNWAIVSILPPDNFFSITNSADYLEDLSSGRMLAQVEGKNKWFLDPLIGFQVGNAQSYLHADPNLDILSHNFSNEWSFTQAKREIAGLIKRDLVDNSSRNLIDSALESHDYNKNLISIGLDPLSPISISNNGALIRNPPLVEDHEIIYEFAEEFKIQNDQFEVNNYQGNPAKIVNDNKYELRSNALSLSLNYPNHLLEIIKGTSVDIFGNVLDINRKIIPLGKQNLSFKTSQNKSETFLDLRDESKKGIAYHFELNARKSKLPDLSSLIDFGRSISNFSFDLDKEGTFKLNIPASSEIGNIPLATRYNNYSDLLTIENSSANPLVFARSENNQDIFAANFAANPSIKLKGEKDLDGYVSPTDRFTNQPIKFGTVFHDISKTCNEFLSTAEFLKAGLKPINFHPGNRLNTLLKPINKIVSDEIIVSGPNANAGGRSGSLSFDGSLVCNIGANTIDRQSLWLDCAGSIISNVGRDKNNLSFAGNYDGDVILQIGGSGLDSSLDSRFTDQSSTYRNGSLEIRVLAYGQMHIIKIGPDLMSFASPGRIELSAEQGISLRTNGVLSLQGEMIQCYPENPQGPRLINRTPVKTI